MLSLYCLVFLLLATSTVRSQNELPAYLRLRGAVDNSDENLWRSMRSDEYKPRRFGAMRNGNLPYYRGLGRK